MAGSYRHWLIISFGLSRRRCSAFSHRLGSNAGLVNEIRASAGTPKSIDALRQLVQTTDYVADEAYTAVFGFELDDFQLSALQSLRKERNVIVCAPTGSGKTVAGELAIVYALSRNERVFYTTPLKALSNQKFTDFRRRFGTDNIGLCTGDSAINREANVVVMTTEVFKNMLYAGDELSRLYGVVLDEFHYMNDEQRGTIWEECVISCPARTRLVALSATVSNADALRGWMSDIHNATDLVEADHRPVPLRYEYAASDRLRPLFRSVDAGPGGLAPPTRRALALNAQLVDSQALHLMPLPNLVATLRRRELLPAIIFQFSRAACDSAAQEQAAQQSLLNASEVGRVRDRIKRGDSGEDDARNAMPPLPSKLVHCLKRGVASHHAGLLPSHKQLVEELFAMGLVKVCYSTETLAAGVNLPARTTVITALSKKAGERGIVRLSSTQVLQMAGRAGRRGLDDLGTVVFAKPRWRHEDARLARSILLSPVEPIESRFRSTYGMVCSLLRRHDLDRCRVLVERSFGTYSRKQRTNAAYIKAEWNRAYPNVDMADAQTYDVLSRRVQELNSAARMFGSDAVDVTLELERAAAQARQSRDNCKLARELDDPEAALQLWHAFNKAAPTPSKAAKAKTYTSPQWREFTNVMRVLGAYGAVTPDGFVAPFGEMVAQLRSDNELFLALAVRSEAFAIVARRGTTAEFASLVACLASDIGEKRTVVTQTPPSILVHDAILDLNTLADTLVASQLDQYLDLDDLPVRLDLRVASTVEAFAAGRPWLDVSNDISIDDGDLVRLLRRTAEILRSISTLPLAPGHLDAKSSKPHCDPIVRTRAARAAAALDRPPVLDYVPATITDSPSTPSPDQE